MKTWGKGGTAPRIFRLGTRRIRPGGFIFLETVQGTN